MRSRFFIAVTALALIAGFLGMLPRLATEAYARQRGQRLILKDGSYQSVEKYEIQGDRVHYLSAERFEWEDVPSSLINWDATKKYNDEITSGKRVRMVETPEEKEERAKEDANSPEIAPGVKLPGAGGVFLFDQFEGKPELAEIVQNGSELDKTAKKKSVMRSAINPFSGSKQAFEIKGEHAQTQSHTARPAIYIDIDQGPQNTAPSDRFRLVRTEVKKDSRVVGSVKVSLSGKVTEQNIFLPVDISKVGTGEWLKWRLAKTCARRIRRGGDAESSGDESLRVGLWRKPERAGESKHMAAVGEGQVAARAGN